MTDANIHKLSIIKSGFLRVFNKQVDDILKTSVSMEDLDSKLSALIDNFDREFDRVIDYYEEKERLES